VNQNQPTTSKPAGTPPAAEKDYVSLEEIEQMRQKMEKEDDEAFRHAIERKLSHRADEKNAAPATDSTSAAAAPSDNPTPTDADAPSEEGTISFPDFPDRSEEDAAAAIFAALQTTELHQGADNPTEAEDRRLFDDVNSAEYTDSEPAEPTAAVSSEEEPQQDDSSAQPSGKKRRRWPWITLACVLFVVVGYLTVLFVPSGPIANLRDLYIQTAMSTADHQWLATWLFPQWAIDRAWKDPNVKPDNVPDDFEGLETVGTNTESVGTTNIETPPAPTTGDVNDPPHTETTAPEKTDPPKQETDILGLASLKVGGTDYAGNKVTVVDVEEGLFISEFTGKSQMIPLTKYHGYVMVIDDPSRVFVGSTPEKDRTGYRILDMMNYYGDVVAGINASGFADPNDSGAGNAVIGACISEGQSWGRYTDTMASVVLTEDNRLKVGWLPNWSNYTNIRDGMQFGPVLVSKGKNLISEDGGGLGAQPRTAIGQREDGAIIMIVIDGRVTSSIGCTLWEMADMMVRYGAVTAGGCDGGSSVVLAYDGKVLNDNSSANPKYGRRIPNAFLVRSKKEDP